METNECRVAAFHDEQSFFWPTRHSMGPHVATIQLTLLSVSIIMIPKLPTSIFKHVIPIPSKHEAFTQCCFNVGPPSSTLAQH